jgi:hypothetical protein
VATLVFGMTVAVRTVPPSDTWSISRAPAEIRYYVSRADLIILSMHDALRRELTNALAQGGPAFAINSCHIDVTGVIQRVAKGEGVAAGPATGCGIQPTSRPNGPLHSSPRTPGDGHATSRGLRSISDQRWA